MSIYIRFRAVMLQWLRVPPEPHAPQGSPGSLRVFRAGLNHYRLRRTLWIIRKGVMLTTLIIGFLFFHAVLTGEFLFFRTLPGRGWISARRPEATRWHVLEWFIVLEAAGFTAALINLIASYVVMRLEYELHWYMVTDRSLRIRDGVTRVREITLSFANIQQIVVRQGPLQRLLGLADVVVTTAGGGSVSTEVSRQAGRSREAWHIGVLKSVDNAETVRDLMLKRLRQLKSAGLGDPEDHLDAGPHSAACTPTAAFVPSAVPSATELSVLGAAQEALEAVRALRAVLGPRG